MLQYDFNESIGCWVGMTAHSFRRALDSLLTQQGITFRQWEVLAWTLLDGELSQTQLAERMNIEASTLAGILDRMERDGWLVRYSCAEDRRKKRIRVAEKAETLWAKMVECAHEVRRRATVGLSPEELGLFKSLCERVRANLDADSGSAEVCTPDVSDQSSKPRSQ